jgi:hypothetical protein
MDVITKALYWVIGLLVAILIIGSGLAIYLVSSGYFNKGQQAVIAQQNTLTSAEFSQYDNKDVTGRDVIEAAVKYAGRPQFSIHVITGVNPVGFYAKNNYSVCYVTPSAGNYVNVLNSSCSGSQTSITDMEDVQKSLSYVNPTGVFSSRIYKDANGEVRLIEFIQK